MRHPKETLYGVLLTVFGLLIWGLAGLIVLVAIMKQPNALVHLIFFGLYAALFFLGSVIGAALLRARAMGHMVRLSEKQFPELHAMLAALSKQMGLSATPQAFIYNSHGVMNAFAMRLLRGRYVFLTSAIVEAEEDAQLRFIMAHEIAHHVLGHLNGFKHLLRAPGLVVPFLYPAYSRAREFSCDAVGAAMIDDVSDAATALQMLACGAKRLNRQMNTRAFAAQEREVPSLAGFLVEIFSSHPRTTSRVERLLSLFPVNKRSSVDPTFGE